MPVRNLPNTAKVWEAEQGELRTTFKSPGVYLVSRALRMQFR